MIPRTSELINAPESPLAFVIAEEERELADETLMEMLREAHNESDLQDKD
jgi:hypothetical protein